MLTVVYPPPVTLWSWVMIVQEAVVLKPHILMHHAAVIFKLAEVRGDLCCGNCGIL